MRSVSVGKLNFHLVVTLTNFINSPISFVTELSSVGSSSCISSKFLMSLNPSSLPLYISVAINAILWAMFLLCIAETISDIISSLGSGSLRISSSNNSKLFLAVRVNAGLYLSRCNVSNSSSVKSVSYSVWAFSIEL